VLPFFCWLLLLLWLVPFPLCPTQTLPSFHIPRRARYDFRSLAFLKSPPPSAQDRVLCTGQGAV
jgi:hypothetical protein